MKRLILLLVFVSAVLPSIAFTQSNKEEVHDPKTKLEQFIAKTGVVIVKGYSDATFRDARKEKAQAAVIVDDFKLPRVEPNRPLSGSRWQLVCEPEAH